MTQIFKYLSKNLFDVILLVFVAVYLFIEFDRPQTALAFIFALTVFLGLPIMTIGLFYHFANNGMAKRTIPRALLIGVFIVTISAVLLYFVSGWMIFSAFLLGGLSLSAFYLLIMFLKKK